MGRGRGGCRSGCHREGLQQGRQSLQQAGIDIIGLVQGATIPLCQQHAPWCPVRLRGQSSAESHRCRTVDRSLPATSQRSSWQSNRRVCTSIMRTRFKDHLSPAANVRLSRHAGVSGVNASRPKVVQAPSAAAVPEVPEAATCTHQPVRQCPSEGSVSAVVPTTMVAPAAAAAHNTSCTSGSASTAQIPGLELCVTGQTVDRQLGTPPAVVKSIPANGKQQLACQDAEEHRLSINCNDHKR